MKKYSRPFAGVSILMLVMFLSLATRPCRSATTQPTDQPGMISDQAIDNLKQIRKWTKTLKGLEVEQAKKVFGKMVPEKSTWGDKDEHLKLTYQFSDFKIGLLCSDGHVFAVFVIVSSIDED